MEAKTKGFVSYTMVCDNCQSVYSSEDAYPERQLCPRCTIVFRAGIKEVVEWIKAHSRDTYERAYGELTLDVKGWQAQLKEWGIDAVLIGEVLVTADDITTKIKELFSDQG